MEEHNIDIVEVNEFGVFKGKEVEFDPIYEYCEYADEILQTEDMIKSNKLKMIDAYRLQAGLLTSYEISNIRDKYTVSQKDFSEILDWGKATVTRYENHQVQDRAHDDVLRMADSDPKWFLDKLELAKERISLKAYNKYKLAASSLYKNHKDAYLVEAIEAAYASYEDPKFNGNNKLKLEKVVDVINYLALNVKSLHKVKLMKLLWYADNLNFKRVGVSITGLRYNALPMGAVPEAHEKIVDLNDVVCHEVYYEDFEYVAQKFQVVKDFEVKYLSDKEVAVIDTIIQELGSMHKKEIVDRMHEENAYIETEAYMPISYEYAKYLSID